MSKLKSECMQVIACMFVLAPAGPESPLFAAVAAMLILTARKHTHSNRGSHGPVLSAKYVGHGNTGRTVDNRSAN